jgi:hypothetical protein
MSNALVPGSHLIAAGKFDDTIVEAQQTPATPRLRLRVKRPKPISGPIQGRVVLSDEQWKQVCGKLESQRRAADALRKFKLTNADEPATVYAAVRAGSSVERINRL